MTGALAHRLKVATPVMQLAAGALLVFFLPVLLYRESVTTSLRAIRRDLRGTSLTGKAVEADGRLQSGQG